MTHVGYPFRPGAGGRTASAGATYVRELIEQVLFTSPGERVNRPTFGCGLARMVFAPNGDALAAATRLTVQGALQQWLGDLIQVQAVEVQNDGATLLITVRYLLLRAQQAQVARFEQGLP